MAKMSGSRVVCRVGVDHELVGAADLEPVEVGQHVRALDAGGPDHELGRDEVAVGQLHAVGA